MLFRSETVKKALSMRTLALEEDVIWVQSEQKRLQNAEDTMIKDARKLVDES